jgi:hypothetical protein
LNLAVVRKWQVGKAALGELYVDGSQFCYTLEDQVREVKDQPVERWKVPNETAIPEGDVRGGDDVLEPFQKVMPQLLAVPGFSGVRIHGGNTAADTEGCILVGEMRDNQGIHNCANVVAQLGRILEQALLKGKVTITITTAFGDPAPEKG